MISITPADALWGPSQQKMRIYGARTELKGTGSLPTGVIQKQVQVRGVQPTSVKHKAAFHTRQHLLVLSQQHGNSYRCWQQGSRMTRRSCCAGIPCARRCSDHRQMHLNGEVAGNSRGTKPLCTPCLQVMLQSVNAEQHMPNPFSMLLTILQSS